ncbi:unnamed protein product [Closterium sp. NIES-54]
MVTSAPYQLVGDAAYPLLAYCLMPLHTPSGRLMLEWQQTFNYCQSATRMSVERTIGQFKGRYRVFAGRHDYALWRVLAGASCVVILHNMGIGMAGPRMKTPNIRWAAISLNRNPWWTRGELAEYKWEACDIVTPFELKERHKRLGMALHDQYPKRRCRDATPQPSH